MLPAGIVLTLLVPFPAGADATDDLASAARSLLAAKCLKCHAADKAEGDLRLDSRAAILKGGERGPAVVPKAPGKSLLLQAVHRSQPDLQMPPAEKLSATEVALLERWTKAGAPWPTSATVPATLKPPAARLGDAWTDPNNPIKQLFKGERLDLWSFRPVKRVPPPRVQSRDAQNPIDAFVASRRQAAGVGPVPPADRRTQLRRLTFDLTGLPPTPEEVEAFIRDDAPDAYERVVDRLLASPRYGEHWGRHWLDVVRYSDSNGFDWDEYRPQAWRFRDYVVRSFNVDKPFDRLVREHLAGDELLTGPPRDRTEQDALIATGFLRLGPQDNSAALFNEQPRARAELLSDLVETTGSAFVGLSFSCCRCHDHKHDPLSQADYYRFRAFFEGVKYGDHVSLDLVSDAERKQRYNAELDRQLKEAQAKLDRLSAKAKEEARRKKVAKLAAADRKLVETRAEKTPEQDKKKRDKLLKQVEPTPAEIAAELPKESRAEFESLVRRPKDLERLRLTPTTGLLMVDAEGTPPPTHVLAQGDHKSPKQAVAPGVPSAFDPNDRPIERCTNRKSTGRRTTLGAWIVSPANPLTARVFVNRVWQGFFGEGLVATPDDFGYAGAKPSDPELLDWLSSEFVAQGWSVKRLHRLIVGSAFYRERLQVRSPASTGNLPIPARRLRRLSAEQLRDAMLAVSGLLHPKHGGPPSWPDLPAEILQANPAFLDDNAEKTKGWYPSPLREQFCRSIFLVQKRTLRVPFLEAFDLPENAATCGRRNVSVVAPQALSLMNSSFTEAVARAFADRVRSQVGDDPGHQLDAAFRLALQRAPTPTERTACHKFLMGRRLPDLCRALVNVNEFIELD